MHLCDFMDPPIVWYRARLFPHAPTTRLTAIMRFRVGEVAFLCCAGLRAVFSGVNQMRRAIHGPKVKIDASSRTKGIKGKVSTPASLLLRRESASAKSRLITLSVHTFVANEFARSRICRSLYLSICGGR